MTEQDNNDKRKEDIIDGIKNMFLENIDQKMRDVIGAELDKMLHGIYMVFSKTINEMGHMHDPDMERTIPVVESHLKRTFRAYFHAREKHPYFADTVGRFDPDEKDNAFRQENVRSAHRYLSYKRGMLEHSYEIHNVRGTAVLECEIDEIEEAIAMNDKDHAVEECYDAIAVLLRMVDVLEGRQALGEPENKKDEKKEGDEE